MTTVLQARSRGFVSTPFIERLTRRALRYLQSGFSVHLRGPAGTGKTTMALHLADLLGRPIMLIFGDDESTTSDLIGNQNGYSRKKVVDNFIHSVVKVEDEMRQNWVDSRLTMACREGFTLVYDEFNRSRPEVNNVLLSALEEKLLVLPPSAQHNEYLRVNPHFRGIFTSNPEEYCGVHATQDALMDRLITIDVPEPDELTQQEIMVQKTGLSRESAYVIVQLVKLFRQGAKVGKSSGLRAALVIAKVCQEHGIPVSARSDDFRDTCGDILLSRTKLDLEEGTQLLWQCLGRLEALEKQAKVSIALARSTASGGSQSSHATDTAIAADPTAESLESSTTAIAGTPPQSTHGSIATVPTPGAPSSLTAPSPIEGHDTHGHDTHGHRGNGQLANGHLTQTDGTQEAEASGHGRNGYGANGHNGKGYEAHGYDNGHANNGHETVTPIAPSPATTDPSANGATLPYPATDLEIHRSPATPDATTPGLDSGEESDREMSPTETNPSRLAAAPTATPDQAPEATTEAQLQAPRSAPPSSPPSPQLPAFTQKNSPQSPQTQLAIAPDPVDGNSSDASPVLVTASLATHAFGNDVEQAIYTYLQASQGQHLSAIESALGISRVQAVDALRSLAEQGWVVVQRDDSASHDAGRTIYRVEPTPA